MKRRSLLALTTAQDATSSAQAVEMLDASHLIYRAGIAPVRNVCDGGHALTFAGDFPTVAKLRAAPIGLGYYGTVAKFGVFRLGGRPAFDITASA